MVGVVSQLWRYPVKSMRGEQCTSLTVDVRGAEADRLYALRESSGKLGSGKTTRRFHKIDGLLDFSAQYDGADAQVLFPDGKSFACADAAIHGALSSVLGEPVTVVREAAESHLDAAPIHIVTSASIRRLRESLPGVAIDERRFRPNLLVDVADSGFVEQSWIGKRLRVGPNVELRVMRATERCGMIALAQDDLPDEPRVLRHVTQELDLRFGVYAEVLVAGVIRVGDPVVSEISVRAFRPDDQEAVRAIVEAGFEARFGHVDRGLNADLVDIAASYSSGGSVFLVAERDGAIVGTIGLLLADTRAQVVRLSVGKEHRRLGVATALLNAVIAVARRRCIPEIVAHTQPEWDDATGFYVSRGFEPFGRDEIDVHLRLRL